MYLTCLMGFVQTEFSFVYSLFFKGNEACLPTGQAGMSLYSCCFVSGKLIQVSSDKLLITFDLNLTR